MFDARLLKSEGKKESIDDTVNNIHSPRRKKLVAGRVASKSASIGSGRVKVEEVVVSMNNLIRAKGERKIKDKRIGEEVNRVESAAKFKAVRSLICGRLDR